LLFVIEKNKSDTKRTNRIQLFLDFHKKGHKFKNVFNRKGIKRIIAILFWVNRMHKK